MTEEKVLPTDVVLNEDEIKQKIESLESLKRLAKYGSEIQKLMRNYLYLVELLKDKTPEENAPGLILKFEKYFNKTTDSMRTSQEFFKYTEKEDIAVIVKPLSILFSQYNSAIKVIDDSSLINLKNSELEELKRNQGIVLLRLGRDSMAEKRLDIKKDYEKKITAFRRAEATTLRNKFFFLTEECQILQNLNDTDETGKIKATIHKIIEDLAILNNPELADLKEMGIWSCTASDERFYKEKLNDIFKIIDSKGKAKFKGFEQIANYVFSPKSKRKGKGKVSRQITDAIKSPPMKIPSHYEIAQVVSDYDFLNSKASDFIFSEIESLEKTISPVFTAEKISMIKSSPLLSEVEKIFGAKVENVTIEPSSTSAIQKPTKRMKIPKKTLEEIKKPRY